MSSSKEQLQAIIQQILQLTNNSIIGVDIGNSSVKVCELAKAGVRGSVVLKAFGMAPIPEGSIYEDEIHSEDDVIAAIRIALDNAKIYSRNACIGLSGPQTILRKMSAPNGPDSEIVDHITWEAEQYIPFGIDNAEVGVHILKKTHPENRDVIMAAAKTETCEYFTEFFKNNGMNLKIIDLQLLALINVFELTYKDRLNELSEGTLLVDIGAQYTKVLVYKKGAPLFTKWIPTAGTIVTEELQKEIGLSFSEAETLKCTRDEQGHYPEEVLETVKIVVSRIIMAIRDSVSIYTHSSATDKIFQCVVTGGSVQLPGIVEGLTEVLNMPVEVLDPLSQLDVKLKGDLYGMEESLTYMSPIAIGLAMRNLDKKK